MTKNSDEIMRSIQDSISAEAESKKSIDPSKLDSPSSTKKFEFPKDSMEKDGSRWLNFVKKIVEKGKRMPFLRYPLNFLTNLLKLPRKFQELYCRVEDLENYCFNRPPDPKEYLLENYQESRKYSKNKEIPKEAYDNFYLAFEERFRGSKENIKKKLEIYLPHISNSNVDFTKFSAIDLGCGRGEWLELLTENNIPAIGIDQNSTMLSELYNQGISVKCADIFDYLSDLPDKSIGLISGFHIVEHLSFDELLQLFMEANRVLINGGLIIFETPNPESLKVGSCNFYIDPTHKNPIPPVTLSFIAEKHAFTDISIVRHSKGDDYSINEQDTPELKKLLEWANKEQDYGIVAHKKGI